MAKKEVAVQATLLVTISAGLWIFFSQKLDFQNVFLNSAYYHSRFLFLLISIFLWIPLIINLLLQTYSKHKTDYNDIIYYKILKGIIHYCLLLLFCILMAIIWAYIAVLLFPYLGWNNSIIIGIIFYVFFIHTVKFIVKLKYKFDIFNCFSY